MPRSTQARLIRSWRAPFSAAGLYCALLVCGDISTPAQSSPVVVQQDNPAQPNQSQTAGGSEGYSSGPGGSATTTAAPGDAAGASAPRLIQPKAKKREAREAENAYLAGAKQMDRGDLDGAEADFQKALKLDPGNENYGLAISIARQHRVTELVRQARTAETSGDRKKAGDLLAKAKALDPASQIVLEHNNLVNGNQSAAAAPGQTDGLPGATPVASWETRLPWKIEAPVLAGAIQLLPSAGTKDFDERGSSADVLRTVTAAYGIRAVIDDSVEQKNLRFRLNGVTYDQAMSALMNMAHVFCVPVDETTVLIADDSDANRGKMEHQLQETINVPGETPEQLNELANVIRTVFDVKQASVQTTLGNLVVRAPEDILEPINQTLRGLIENSEVMIDVKLYEVNTTRSNNVGATLPTQFTAFNVDQAATQIVNNNQTLVQQAVAQGYIPSTASNLQIALALIGAGLVQSNLATNLIGVFGGGALQTGIAASSNTTFTFALNSTDTRTLDNVQLRVGNRQTATFREGTKYPIITSSYTTGVSTAASSLSNASINGVSVASLLSQYAGGTSATIPQVTYEDLGVTLNATPMIQKSDRVHLHLELKIEALSGGSANGMPILESRQFNSDLTLKDGESAMMVSSVTKTETTALNGLPGLSELPGFQMPILRNAERDEGQLVVIVTPHVVRRRSEQVTGPQIPLPPMSDN